MLQLLLVLIYFAFISLGLLDALLGAAWPSLYPSLGVPISYAGVISMIISAGTIVSSLLSDRLHRRFGTGRITAFSVSLTAIALFGFSFSTSFIQLCVWAIPYGLGAGSVDAALNNYVALHYESRHMNWLHCMWGIGASLGPYLMGLCLTHGWGWASGYRSVGAIQVVLSAVLLFTLPLWKKAEGPRAAATSVGATSKEKSAPASGLSAILSLPGAKAILLCFFCYSALEATVGLWASSFLSLAIGVDPKVAAGFAGLFYLGITGGRAASGFLSLRFDDDALIRGGLLTIGLGLVFLGMSLFCGMLWANPAASLPPMLALIGLILMGLGCAPIYPGIIHSTPAHFGEERSQAMIGMQMACAYVGSCFLPPLFGMLARSVSVALLPLYVFLLLALMGFMHRRVVRATAVR
ncbi:MFS transporter [Murdochiella vaginalis]|uniref:MFS transporter n=1 Tax=Murdochiella vaginalis TaxID=1852373 RepID=UPI0008FE862B|nr:MFS transporter [Murdochiella vaginalis]